MQKFHFSSIAAAIFGLCCLISCQNHQESAPQPTAKGYGKTSQDAYLSAPQSANAVAESDQNANPTEAATQDVFKSAITARQPIDSLKKLVRSAEIMFKTKKTLQTGLEIEKIAQQNGGFVLENNYIETKERVEDQRISKDSVLQISTIKPHSQILLRVPYQYLDTTLRAIGKLAIHVDYRRLKAEDVTLQMMEENLARLRNQQYGANIQEDIAGKGKQLTDISAARERQFNAKTGEDIAKIEGLRLDDRVRFSNISIDVYGDVFERRDLKSFPIAHQDWKPNFGTKLVKALAGGWSILMALFIGLAYLWPIWLLLGLWYWIFRGKKRWDLAVLLKK